MIHFTAASIALGVGRGNLHRAVVFDVHFRAGLFHDFADHLAAGADHVADLVGRDCDLDDARGVLADFAARRVHGLVHFAEDVQAAGVSAIERDRA